MVDRERLKYLTRAAFVESKRRLVRDRILKWHTRLVSHDGNVYVMPRIPDAPFRAGNLLGLPSVNWLAKAAAAMIRVTDGWTLEMTPEQERLLLEDQATAPPSSRSARRRGWRRQPRRGLAR